MYLTTDLDGVAHMSFTPKFLLQLVAVTTLLLVLPWVGHIPQIEQFLKPP